MLAVQSGIYKLLIIMARQMKTNGDFKHKRSDGDVYFNHILEYIDAHSSEQIEVQDLAEMCSMSYSHFARSFKARYGRSCKEYILYIRLNKAQNMLLYSDYSMEYIAQENGFRTAVILSVCIKSGGESLRNRKGCRTDFSIPIGCK